MPSKLEQFGSDVAAGVYSVQRPSEGSGFLNLQNPLIKEYTVNHIRDPIII